MVPKTLRLPVRPHARTLALLAVVVVALAGVVSRPAHAAATKTVRVKNYSYSEPDLVIDLGTEVTWIADQGDHTVTSDGGSFDEVIAQDSTPHTFSYTPPKPGRYTYHCEFHGEAKGMTAVLEVLDPSGGPTTTEPPTTTTTWSPPTTTTAPATTTTAPPVTATTAAPTATTSAPLPTSTSTAPVAAPASIPPATTPPAPPAGTRSGQAGAAKGAAPAPVTSPTPATTPAGAPTATAPPAGELTPARDTTASSGWPALAAPAPAARQQAGAETSSPSRAQDGHGPVLVLLLAAGGLLALAGAGTVVWRRRD